MQTNHPHQHFLDEFKIAINHLVPLTPPGVKEQALTFHKELSENQASTEDQIREALTIIGKQEYPYRLAFNELCSGDEEQRLQAAVFERLDESLATKVKEVTSHGVILEDYVSSSAFEESLTPEERYQLEQAILIVDDVLENQCDDRAQARTSSYEELVTKHKAEASGLEALIAKLQTMAEGSSKHDDEIQTTVDRLNEGWAITNRDPMREEIEKELEYWNAIFAEQEGE